MMLDMFHDEGQVPFHSLWFVSLVLPQRRACHYLSLFSLHQLTLPNTLSFCRYGRADLGLEGIKSFFRKPSMWSHLRKAAAPGTNHRVVEAAAVGERSTMPGWAHSGYTVGEATQAVEAMHSHGRWSKNIRNTYTQNRPDRFSFKLLQCQCWSILCIYHFDDGRAQTCW